MDQRHPPHNYSRSQDRPLIQNPNHQPPSQPPPPPHSHATLYHTSSSQQPPVQIPFMDPFQRRAPDPFLPNTQGQRRGSYGVPPARDAVSVGGHTDRPSLAGAWLSTTGTQEHFLHLAYISRAGGSNVISAHPFLQLMGRLHNIYHQIKPLLQGLDDSTAGFRCVAPVGLMQLHAGSTLVRQRADHLPVNFCMGCFRKSCYVFAPVSS